MFTILCCTNSAFGNNNETQLPSKGLLEFLADMEKVNGEYVAPVDMLALKEPALQTSETNALKSQLNKNAKSKQTDKVDPTELSINEPVIKKVEK